MSVQTEQDPGAAGVATLHAEPTVRVRAPWVAGFVLAGFGWQILSQVPTTFTIPQQIKDIDPAGHIADFGWINSLGVVAAIVLGPLFGIMSDRTASRFGRRRPWMAAGGVAGVVSLVLTGATHSVWGVGIGYFLQTVAVCIITAGITTIVPDRVPAGQRGTVLGWGAVPMAAALVVGGMLVSLSKGYLGQYVFLSVPLVFLLFFAWRTGDQVLPAAERSEFSWRIFLNSYKIKVRQYPDFGWALATRFLMVFGYGLGTLYIPYFLSDVLGFPNDSSDPHLLQVVGINSLSTIALCVVAGWLSDRVGIRRPFVAVGSAVMAVAAMLLALHETWGMTLVAAAVLGLGYGVYLSVDGALITQTLPSGADRGRDMGFANLMATIPFAVVPVAASLLIKFAGGYPALFWTSAAASVAGAACIFRIRGVK